MTMIYHLARKLAWQAAEKTGIYCGTPEDKADGFIHFSTAAQVAESAARHRAGETDLLLVGVDDGALGGALKWEIARDGSFFPHLYANLSLADVLSLEALPVDENGKHIFPEMEK